MLYLDINGKPLLLPAGTRAQVEHISPLFADGLEDSFSLPVELPVDGNEEVLGHVHELPLRERTLSFPQATLGHLGMPLFPGVLHVLSTTERAVRSTFSVEGFVSRISGIMLPATLRNELIDLSDEEENQNIDFKTRPNYVDGGKCQFPMHRNPSLYGDANPDWQPSASKYEPGTAYTINALVEYTDFGTIRTTGIWQCIENTTAGQSPESHPDKWRRAAFAIVNAWDRDNNTFYLNTTTQNYYTLVPWFYLKWVLKTALAFVGYTPVGQFMDDEGQHEWTLPNTTTIDADNTIDGQYFFRAEQSSIVYYNPANGQANYRIPAQNESTLPNQDPEGMWNNSTMRFVCLVPGRFRFIIWLTFNTDTQPNRTRVVVRMHDATGAIRASTIVFMQRQSLSLQASMIVEMEAGDVTESFWFSAIQQNTNGTITSWPTASNHHYTATRIMGWLSAADPVIAVPDRFIYPHRHVPDWELLDFLIAIADAFNTTLDPDEATRTLRMDYKESALQDVASNRTDQSHRQVNSVEIDHQRAIPGVKLAWDIDTNKEDPLELDGIPEYISSLDVTPAISTGQKAVLQSTRKLLKSVFREGEFLWEPVGYHVPPVLVGNADGALEVTPGCKPVHMDQVWLDGRQYIMPLLDAPGTSAWFHTEGERSTFWLCEFKRQTSSDGTVFNVPGARSWGYGWTADDRSRSTLLWNSPDPQLPGMYQTHWQRWATMLTTAEPVTMDLLVDLPYLTGRQWRGLHHIHGQDYLVEKLPMEYGGTRGQLVSRGAYLMRLKGELPPAVVEAVEPGFVCAGPGALSVTVTDADDAACAMVATTGYFSTRTPSGVISTFSTEDQVDLDELGTWCLWPSNEEGEMEGAWTYVAMGFGGIDPVDLSPLNGSGPMGNGFEALYFDSVTWTTLQLPTLVGSNAGVSINSDTLTEITVPSGVLFSFFLIGAPLDESSVDALCNALDTSVTGQGTEFWGTAAPTAASLATRDAYVAAGNTIAFL